MKSLYTFEEIIDKVNSNDYNAEMMLQHFIVRYAELEKKLVEARIEADIVRSFLDADYARWTFPWEEGNE